MTRGFHVGAVPIDPPTILAPMEGITDRGFRRLIRGFGGCGLTVTEFVSSDMLARQVRRAWEMAELDPGEHPVSIQIYGRRPDQMAEAAGHAQALGADLVDLNLGCPSKAVTSGCSGSALMREPELARAIFAAVRAAITVPMTVKMRLGWDDDRRNASEIARIAEGEGAQMITVHGRTRMQMYRGAADWSAIREVKDAVGVPVVVNGDVLTVADAVEALAQSGADGVMVGRGTMRDPWILRRIADHLRGVEFVEPALAERRDVLLGYFAMMRDESKTSHRALGRIKKVTGYFTRALPYGAELREQIFHSHALDAIDEAVCRYFERLAAEGIDDGFARLHADTVTEFTDGDPRNLERAS